MTKISSNNAEPPKREKLTFSDKITVLQGGQGGETHRGHLSKSGRHNSGSHLDQEARQAEVESGVQQSGRRAQLVETAKKKIKKALLIARFTKDTRLGAQITDIRKQISAAKEVDFKPLTGLSRELN